MAQPSSGDMRPVQRIALAGGVAAFVAGLLLRSDPVIVTGLAFFGLLALSEHGERAAQWLRKKRGS